MEWCSVFREKERYIIYTRQQIFIILSFATVRWTIYLHREAFRQNNESLMQKKHLYVNVLSDIILTQLIRLRNQFNQKRRINPSFGWTVKIIEADRRWSVHFKSDLDNNNARTSAKFLLTSVRPFIFRYPQRKPFSWSTC